MSKLIAKRKSDGTVVRRGDALPYATGSKPTAHTYLYATRETAGNSSGKVFVREIGGGDGELFAHVFGLTVELQD
jgi:hypothetical protein